MQVVGTERIRIARDEDTVRAQFFDVAHHVDQRVHSGPKWKLLREHDGTKTVRLGPQLTEIRWVDDVLWLEVIGGPGVGSTIEHRFETIGSDTEVIATFTVPLPRWSGPLASLVRWFVARQLRRGLAEDAHDLRTYRR